MNIVVNTRLLLNDRLEGIGYFVREVCLRIAAHHPEHRFYFLFDRPVDPGLALPANVTPLVIGPQARHPVLWKIWFDWRLPQVLKKVKADVFFSPESFASLRSRVPQCIILHDLGFLHFPAAYKYSHFLFYRHYFPRFIKKARRMAAVSAFTRADAAEHYGIDAGKIDLVYSAAKRVFKPVAGTARTAIQDQYSEGKEYFIYAGAIQPRKNLVNLLKAFSLFKKRQRTNMKLVLAGRMAWKNDAFIQLLKTYKYRADVVLTGYLPEEELARLVAAAYAMVYPSVLEGFGVPVLEALQSGVPALTTQGTAMQEIAGEAALYFDASEPADIAEKMMRIYKDEPLRNALVAKGLLRAKEFGWDRTAELVWSSIMKTVTDPASPASSISLPD